MAREPWGEDIAVSPYDPAWPVAYGAEEARLRDALGPAAVAIEHVGSTAVPGLSAKPVIDIAVGVAILEQGAVYLELLAPLGYAYRPDMEEQHPDRRFFRRGESARWTHHLHVVEHLSPRWGRLLLLRDHLRRHPDEVALYARTKEDVSACVGDDIAAYRDGKSEVVRAILGRALAEKPDS